MESLRTIALYVRTLRYLRPVQLYGRVWRALRRPRPDLSIAPPRRLPANALTPPARRRPSMIAPGDFIFLNKQGTLGSAVDWNAPAQEKLWLYNLHYFDDLNAEAAEERNAWHTEMLARWVAENPPGQGNGWEAYPLSLRMVNWIKWALAGNSLDPTWIQSLVIQARYLRDSIEWHLLGNHLFANAKALAFVGAFFTGHEADDWRREGLDILARETPEQALADGGHFELSPMYHSIILEDLLDLINLTRVYPGLFPQAAVEGWRDAVSRMRRWLAVMIHPDGEISFFNDAAFGIAPAPSALDAYAVRLGQGACDPLWEDVIHLPQSGYIRVQTGDVVALLDVAAVGPDYLPGHAHADTLSFELSLGEARVIVNSGTSVYGAGHERLRQRSTAAHSTVEVDRENSTEVWGGFRVARRARPRGLEIARREGALVVKGAHDGYTRLRGHVIHEREWRFQDCCVSVTDTLHGELREAIARFHFHPHVAAEGAGLEGRLSIPGGREATWTLSGGQGRIVAGAWLPEFGLSIPNQRLEVALTDAKCTTTFAW